MRRLKKLFFGKSRAYGLSKEELFGEMEVGLRAKLQDWLLSDNEFCRELVARTLTIPRIFGDKERVSISATAVVNDALINTSSGSVTIGDFAFFGHNVSLITGTHDYHQYDRDRQLAIPAGGRDIIIEKGAWVSSNVTVLGPCVIGENAVIAAGAVVIDDVPSNTIYGGVPAKFLKKIDRHG